MKDYRCNNAEVLLLLFILFFFKDLKDIVAEYISGWRREKENVIKEKCFLWTIQSKTINFHWVTCTVANCRGRRSYLSSELDCLPALASVVEIQRVTSFPA